MKVIAIRKRRNTEEYINIMLMEAIERDKFVESYAPSLSKVGYEEDILFIRDAKLGKTGEIYLRHDSFTVMSANLKTVSIFVMLLPCQKRRSSICIG